MNYEVFYKFFLQHGFTYLTTDKNHDIYEREGHEYKFNFINGTIYRHPLKSKPYKFSRNIHEAKGELLKYFKDEKRNEAIELWRQKKG